MVNSPAAIVNQRLYYCRLHLDWIHSIASDPNAPAATQPAAQESLVYHLVMAYRAYLSEIATKYGEPDTSAKSAIALVSVMADKGHSSAELERVRVLESRESWLSSLLTCFQASKQGRMATAALKLSSEHSEINFINIDNQLAIEVKVNYQQVFDQLKELIDSQRETMEEW